MSVVLHTSRFAYKSICIHRGLFTNTILVDSHTSKSFRIQFESTTLKSIRIHNLSRFTYKKVDLPTQSKFKIILCSEHYSRWLTTRARTFFLNIACIDKKWTLKKRKQVSASLIHFKLISEHQRKLPNTFWSYELVWPKIILKLLVPSLRLFIFILAFMYCIANSN